MKERFVLIFRQGKKPLSSGGQKARAAEVREWALQRRKDDPNFEPRVLGDDSHYLGNGGPATIDNDPVIALNFLEADDIREAIAIAQTSGKFARGKTREVQHRRKPKRPCTHVSGRSTTFQARGRFVIMRKADKKTKAGVMPAMCASIEGPTGIEVEDVAVRRERAIDPGDVLSSGA